MGGSQEQTMVGSQEQDEVTCVQKDNSEPYGLVEQDHECVEAARSRPVTPCSRPMTPSRTDEETQAEDITTEETHHCEQGPSIR
jgi:hypothetical protein